MYFAIILILEICLIADDDKGYVDINQENVEIDESPIVIIIPGLTSDSESPVSQ